jgi:hypothetical protein
MMKNALLPNLVKGEEVLRAQKQYLLETVGKKIEELCPGWLKADKMGRYALSSCCAKTCEPFKLAAPYARVSFILNGDTRALALFYERVEKGFPITMPRRGNEGRLLNGKGMRWKKRRK